MLKFVDKYFLFLLNNKSIVMFADLPGDLDPHADILITGVESEEVEEINDAYEDVMMELG